MMLSKFRTIIQMLVAKNTNIYHAEVPAAHVPKDKFNNKKYPAGDCPGVDQDLGEGDEKHTCFCLTIQTITPTQRSKPALSTASSSKCQTLR
eukprot:463651-Ditylum_brightwellii.AAC.1